VTISNNPKNIDSVVSVARSRQVYIEWLEVTVLSIYLPEEKEDVYMYTRPTLLPKQPAA